MPVPQKSGYTQKHGLNAGTLAGNQNQKLAEGIQEAKDNVVSSQESLSWNEWESRNPVTVAFLDTRRTEDTRIDYRKALRQMLGDSADRYLETGPEDDSAESRSKRKALKMMRETIFMQFAGKKKLTHT